ncbi:DUF1616 domain-containing protein [Haladaptatus sp. NG-SE-30]
MSHGANDSWWSRITHPVLSLPVDLVGVVLTVAVVTFVLAQPVVRGTPVAVALGLPFVLFTPGYALVSLLFPGAGPPSPSGWSSPVQLRRDGITPGERAALSFGVSLALLPLLALSLAVVSVSFEPLPVLVAVFGLTFVLSVMAAIRRGRVPPNDRFSVSIRGSGSRLRALLYDGETRADIVLNVVLALSVVVALSTVGYAVVAPQNGEQFSQLSLLTRTDDGKFVTEGYPESFEPGEQKPVYVSIANHEGESVEYTVVVELQRVEQRSGGSVRIVEEVERARFSHRVAAGKSWRTRYDIGPTMAGEDLRVVFLLYEGEPPADPTTSNADEHAYIWIDVVE